MSLNKLDLMIIEELENDARQSIPAIAEKLGIKKSTIRYRLDRLINEQLLTVVCLGNPELLENQFQIFIGINVLPGMAEVVGKKLEPLPEIKILCLGVGRYRILASALFQNRLTLKHFITEYLLKTPEITSFEIVIAYQWVKSYWKYFKSQTEKKHPHYDPSDLDLAIIKAMKQDPRQTLTDLAETVGCNKLMAKRRLDKLLEKGVIRFACILTPTPMGWYGLSIVMLIECELDKVTSVADELSVQGTARLVGLVAGRWHIFYGATFKDNNDMQHFLSEKLDMISGIIKYEIFYITNILKYTIIFQE